MEQFSKQLRFRLGMAPPPAIPAGYELQTAARHQCWCITFACCHIRTATIAVLALQAYAVVSIFLLSAASILMMPKVPEPDKEATRAFGLFKAVAVISVLAALALFIGVVCCVIAIQSTLRAELVWPYIASQLLATAATILAVILTVIAINSFGDETGASGKSGIGETTVMDERLRQLLTRIELMSDAKLKEELRELHAHFLDSFAALLGSLPRDVKEMANDIIQSLNKGFDKKESKFDHETVQRIHLFVSEQSTTMSVAAVFMGIIYVGVQLWSVRLSFQLKGFLFERRLQPPRPIELAAQKVVA